MPDIVISELMDEKSIAALRHDFDVHYDPDLWKDSEELAASLQSVRGLIVRNRTQVTEEVLQKAPDIRVIGRLGVGLDNIDLQYCKAKGIDVYPATGANARSVAEYVIAAIYMLMRGAYFSSVRLIEGEWPRQELIGEEISGKTIGIAGFGSIGQVTAKLAIANGMKAVASDPKLHEKDPAWDIIKRVNFRDLLRESDVVSLHMPLLDETRNLIDGRALALMKQGAFLINTARGGIVDENALVEALRSGHLCGAALDVFSEEPLDEVSGARFRGVPNLILTPHIAGISAESNSRVCQMTADNVKAALQRRA